MIRGVLLPLAAMVLTAAPMRGLDAPADNAVDRAAVTADAGRRGEAADDAVRAHLAALDLKIARLEAANGTAAGRGAYRHGPTLRIDGGDETVLERLRRQDRELAEARAAIANRDGQIDGLRARLKDLSEHGTALAEKADSLSYTRDALVTAQGHIAELRSRLDHITGQLAASELQRLRAEREYYQLAAAALKLSPGQTVELTDLQEQVRGRAKHLVPADGPAADGGSAERRP